jgi:hypothetical protein
MNHLTAIFILKYKQFNVLTSVTPKFSDVLTQNKLRFHRKSNKASLWIMFSHSSMQGKKESIIKAKQGSIIKTMKASYKDVK